MRERLIEIVKQSLFRHIDKTCCLAENTTDDLLNEGVIVPPCKVGQTVWYVSKWAKSAMPIQVISYEVTSWGIDSFGCWGGDFTPTSFEAEAIGKTVFLTREEAEKALREAKG